MDSEKYLKLEKAIEDGKSPTDEGPFYHHSWWEAYKGSIKGKLGGMVIGAVLGAALGGVVAGIMTWAGVAGALTAFAGVAGAGLLYGMVEFSEIGKIVGAQAATQEQADAREAIRFSAIERKIDHLTNLVKGKVTAEGKKNNTPDVDTSRETEALATYRKTHYAKLNGSTKGPIFWKIAAIGLLVGAAAGLILASGGTTGVVGEFVAHTLGLTDITTGGLSAAAAGLMGLFGASFGINRDYFRKIFDTTDLWSKGIFNSKKVDSLQEEAGKKFEKENGLEHGKKESDVATAVAPPGGYLDYPASATFHRDRVIKASAQALHELDHTRATPH